MANNKNSYESSMRIRAILFIVVFLLMVAVIISLLDGMGISIGGKKDEAPEPEEIQEVLETPAPTQALPVFTPAPIPEEEFEVVIVPTPQPAAQQEVVPTVVPENTPEIWGQQLGSGRITSNTGTGLNVVADWTAVSQQDSKVAFTVNVYLQSYGISTVSQPVTVSVGGESTTVYGSAVNYDGNSQKETHLATVNVTVTLAPGGTASFPISAAWQYNGSYSGQSFGTITASGTVTLSR